MKQIPCSLSLWLVTFKFIITLQSVSYRYQICVHCFCALQTTEFMTESANFRMSGIKMAGGFPTQYFRVLFGTCIGAGMLVKYTPNEGMTMQTQWAYTVYSTLSRTRSSSLDVSRSRVNQPNLGEDTSDNNVLKRILYLNFFCVYGLAIYGRFDCVTFIGSSYDIVIRWAHCE